MVKEVYFNCGEIDGLSFIEKDQVQYYILPSQEALMSKKKEYLYQVGGTTQVYFMTFDDIVRKNIKGKHAGRIFEQFILRRIIEKNRPDYHYKGFVILLREFFQGLAMQKISPTDLAKTKDPLFQSLAPIYKEYQEYFQSRNLLIDKGYSRGGEEPLEGEYFIIDGFYDFRQGELDIIENLSRNAKVIINIPFQIQGMQIPQKLVQKLKEMGFTIHYGSHLSVKDYIGPSQVKAVFTKNNHWNLLFASLKKTLSKNPKDPCRIICGDQETAQRIFLQSSFESIDCNGNFQRDSKIIQELKILLTFLHRRKKKELLQRLDLFYFPIPEKTDPVMDLLIKIPFQQVEDLEHIQNLPLSEGDIKDYLNVLEALREEAMPQRESLDFYIQKLERYLQPLPEIIEDHFQRLGNEDFYRRDLETVENLELLLEDLRQYREFFPQISYEELNELLEDLLDDSSNYMLRNRKGVPVATLSKGYFGQEKYCFLIGFENKYEGSSHNILYGKSREASLRNFGMTVNEEEGDFLKLLHLIQKSRDNVFIFPQREEGYGSLFQRLVKELSVSMIEDPTVYITWKEASSSSLIEKDRPMELSPVSKKKLQERLQNRSFSSTDFDLYAQCGRKFLLDRIFQGEKYQKKEMDRRYLDLGEKYHNVLEKYYQEYEEELNEEKLKSYIYQEILKDSHRDFLSFAEKVQWNNYFQTLKQYLEQELEDMKESGYRPVAREERFQFETGLFTMTGRIDRVDEKDGVEKLTDYKLSTGKTTKDILELKAFQLPIYAWSRILKGKEIAECRYGNLHQGKFQNVLRNLEHVPKNRQYCNFSGEEFQEILNSSQNEIFRLYSEMLSGHFPGDSDDCKYCIYQDFCYRR
ncbi:MAG: PD-(D/E)XK nuclease family protein [Tissierellia bacterium]|nr:PD-(D/E)XK nuclease family protein [Tissierellia bacterium]